MKAMQRMSTRLFAVAAGLALLVGTGVLAQAQPVKVGLVLPYSSVYATLGNDITNGLNLAFDQAGNEVAGRPIEVMKQDSQVNPKVGLQVTMKFVQQEQVDFLVGPVASHVAMAMRKPAHDSGTFMIIANAGNDALTREARSPYVFRTSFSNWQPNYPMGPWMMENDGVKKVSILAPNYAAGKQQMAGFKEGFEAAGGEVVSEQYPKLGEADFQPYLSRIAQDDPDAVYVFFAGSDAVKFVKQYAQAGLNEKYPLYGSGFLTGSTVLAAQGEAALGVKTGMFYHASLDNAANEAFVSAYRDAYGEIPSLYAMQGYDTGLAILQALEAVGGNTDDKEALRQALENVSFDSPRGGEFRFNEAHNVIQNIYVREVVQGADGVQNRVIGTAAEDLEDPGTGCNL